MMFNETWLGMFEVILESAPQFIIQLHATMVQQEQVSAIQITTRNFLNAYFLKKLNWKTGHAVFAGFPTKWKVRLIAICVLSIELRLKTL